MLTKLGLTGNIAAGKTTIENIFKKLGIPTFCADEYCHFLIENNKEVQTKIFKTFSGHDFLTDKKIDRKKLRELIFSDKKAKKSLEKILHPLVKEKIFSFFKENKMEPFAVATVPLLFEVGLEKMFDKTILVCADEQTRAKRIKKRNNFDSVLIKQIMNSQLSQEEKKQRADFIISNDEEGPFILEKKIKAILETLK